MSKYVITFVFTKMLLLRWFHIYYILIPTIENLIATLDGGWLNEDFVREEEVDHNLRICRIFDG